MASSPPTISTPCSSTRPPRPPSHASPALPPAPFPASSSPPASSTRRGAAGRAPRGSMRWTSARHLQSRRLWTYTLTFGYAAGFMVTVLATFQYQLVFYLTPTDALARFAANPSKTRCWLGGLVLEGSVAHPLTSSAEIKFIVTDLVPEVLVCYEGALPDLFHEGHSIVVEGFRKPLTDDLLSDGVRRKLSKKAREIDCFLCDTEVLATHDKKYMPKEVGKAIERNKKHIETEAVTAAAKETTMVAVDVIKASS